MDRLRRLEFEFQDLGALMPFELEVARRHRHDARKLARAVGECFDECASGRYDIRIDRGRAVPIPVRTQPGESIKRLFDLAQIESDRHRARFWSSAMSLSLQNTRNARRAGAERDSPKWS